jgi:hypothetical protein
LINTFSSEDSWLCGERKECVLFVVLISGAIFLASDGESGLSDVVNTHQQKSISFVSFSRTKVLFFEVEMQETYRGEKAGVV